jgi:hypothetical protein
MIHATLTRRHLDRSAPALSGQTPAFVFIQEAIHGR